MSALIISLVLGACVLAATIGGSILALRAAARDRRAPSPQGGDGSLDDTDTELSALLAAEGAASLRNSKRN